MLNDKILGSFALTRYCNQVSFGSYLTKCKQVNKCFSVATHIRSHSGQIFLALHC